MLHIIYIDQWREKSIKGNPSVYDQSLGRLVNNLMEEDALRWMSGLDRPFKLIDFITPPKFVRKSERNLLIQRAMLNLLRNLNSASCTYLGQPGFFLDNVALNLPSAFLMSPYIANWPAVRVPTYHT